MKFIRRGGRIIPIREKGEKTALDTARNTYANALDFGAGYSIATGLKHSKSIKDFALFTGMSIGLGLASKATQGRDRNKTLGLASYFSGVGIGMFGIRNTVSAGAKGLDKIRNLSSDVKAQSNIISGKLKKLKMLRKVKSTNGNVINVDFRK